METLINVLSQPPNKDVVLWIVLIENVAILVYLLRQWIKRWHQTKPEVDRYYEN